VPVSTTTSPVTHTADVEVNKASKKPTLLPSLADIGNVNKTAPVSISKAKPTAKIWVGFNLLSPTSSILILTAPEKSKKATVYAAFISRLL